MGKYKQSKNNYPVYQDHTEVFDRDTMKSRVDELEEPEESELDNNYVRKGYLAWGVMRPLLIFLVSLGIVIVGLIIGYNYVNSHYLTPTDTGNKTPISIEIKNGSSVTTIAKTLYDKGLIKNKTVFKFYVDFSDMTSKLKAGTYKLNKSMSMDDIMFTLSKGDGRPKVTTFTVTEGMTVDDMAKSLASKGVIKDQAAFLKLCKEGTDFYDYGFVADLDPASEEENASDKTAVQISNENKQKKYMLEGYLFPDTYEIFTDSSNDTIIRKMLDRFSQIFNDTYVKRADELKMSINEIVTMASIIEREGKPQDFKKIAAVFHNRIKQNMPLGSDVTVQYILGVKKLNLTSADLNIKSPYNTFTNKGLPIGPISNPGKNAMEAALYPDEQYKKDGYLYFCLTDPETGALAFSKTKKEHDALVAKYRPLWEAYDKAHGG